MAVHPMKSYEVSNSSEDKDADVRVYTLDGDSLSSLESWDRVTPMAPAGGDAVVNPPQLPDLNAVVNPPQLPDLNDAELEKAAIVIQVSERIRQARRRLMNQDLKRISYHEGVEPHVPKWMIHPEGRFRITWNMLVAVILLYISLAVPLQIGFDVDPDGGWAVFEHILDGFFLVDLCVNFRTGFIEEDSHLVMDELRSALHYGKSVGFVIDFVTTVPFDLIMHAASSQGDDDSDDSGGGAAKRAQRLLKVARILKAVKMLRLNKLLRGSVLEMYEDLMSSSASVRFLLRVVKVMFALAFTLHWMACGWYLVSDTKQGADAHQNSWVHVYLGDDGATDEFSLPASDRFSLDTRYLAAMYWAATTLTTVGYGDITPQSDAERLFCFFGMIIGGAGYGFLVGECASVVSEVDAHTKQYNERMESIIAYMGQRNFPVTLQRKIKRFYRRYFKEKSALNEQTVLAELSTKLKNEVALFVVNALVVKNPLFVGLSTQSLSEMTALVRPVFYEVDEHMVHMGEDIIDLQVISLGIATVIDSDGSVLCELKPGSSFGAESIMTDPNSGGGSGRPNTPSIPTWNCTVVATQPCECLQIPTEELRALFSGGAHHQGVLETIKRNARANLTDVCITQQAVLAQGAEAIAKSLKALIDPNSAGAEFSAASSRGPAALAAQGGGQGGRPASAPLGLSFVKFADVAKRAMAAQSFQNVIAQPTKGTSSKDQPKATDGSDRLKLIEDGVERLSQSIATQSREQSARIGRLEQANQTLTAALARSEAREEKMLQLLSTLSTR